VRAFLDTNIIVYAHDGDEVAKQAQALELLERIGRTATAIISTQVLKEFYWVVTSKLRRPVPEDLAHEALLSLASLEVVQVSTGVILDAVRTSRVRALSWWDALIVEAALAGGASILYSEDLQDGRTFGDLKVVNPFS
jgi:predicted nucleic acid-binding protein